MDYLVLSRISATAILEFGGSGTKKVMPSFRESYAVADPMAVENSNYPWQVICVKWGSRYSADFVNRLYSMVVRNTSQPVRFICLTDDFSGIRPEVECMQLPELPCAHPERTIGKWRKLVLWGADWGPVTGPLLFIDLDSVIVDNIDGYFTHGDPHDVILARNWARPGKRLGQTSVFRFFVGENRHILETFASDPQGVADRFHFEQHFVTASASGGIKFWPEEWTRHFRIHCLPQMPLRYFLSPRLPRGSKIITFPGGPDPVHVIEGRWDTKSRPHVGRVEHVLNAFIGKRSTPGLWKHLKRYVRPTSWVANAWRD